MAKLKSTNPKNRDAALRAFIKQRNISRGRRENFTCFHEHEQFWIEDRSIGATWSVVDATVGKAVNGYDFERVSQGVE
jgi:hypothetical protein